MENTSTPGHKKSPQLSMTVSSDLIDRLDRIAERDRRSRSDAARLLLTAITVAFDAQEELGWPERIDLTQFVSVLLSRAKERSRRRSADVPFGLRGVLVSFPASASAE